MVLQTRNPVARFPVLQRRRPPIKSKCVVTLRGIIESFVVLHSQPSKSTERGRIEMARNSNNAKNQAHELIDRLAPTQVSAVVGLLEAMLDPVSRAIANAPLDDEPETDSERDAVSESKTWFQQREGQGIPHKEVVAESD